MNSNAKRVRVLLHKNWHNISSDIWGTVFGYLENKTRLLVISRICRRWCDLSRAGFGWTDWTWSDIANPLHVTLHPHRAACIRASVIRMINGFSGFQWRKLNVCTKLKSLTLPEDITAVELGQLQPLAQSLRSLQFDWMGQTLLSFDAAPSIALFPNLTHLKLPRSAGDSSLKSLASLTALTNLDLSDSDVTGRGLQHVSIGLTSLNINCNYFRDVDALTRFPSLTWLEMSSLLQFPPFMQLIDALPCIQNASLKHLKLPTFTLLHPPPMPLMLGKLCLELTVRLCAETDTCIQRVVELLPNLTALEIQDLNRQRQDSALRPLSR